MAQAERWLSTFRQRVTWSEGSGAVGDLGTFLPLLVRVCMHSGLRQALPARALSACAQVGLTQAVGLDLGTTLIFTGTTECLPCPLGRLRAPPGTVVRAGVYNIATGCLFDIPMPVQPMKAIAAVAIASPSFDLAQVMAAGIFVGAVVLVLGATRLIDAFHRCGTSCTRPAPDDYGAHVLQALAASVQDASLRCWFTCLAWCAPADKRALRLVPGSVIRGIQLSVGLNLAQKGVSLVAMQDATRFRGLGGLIPGIAAAAFVLVTSYWPVRRPCCAVLQASSKGMGRQSQQSTQSGPTAVASPALQMSRCTLSRACFAACCRVPWGRPAAEQRSEVGRGGQLRQGPRPGSAPAAGARQPGLGWVPGSRSLNAPPGSRLAFSGLLQSV